MIPPALAAIVWCIVVAVRKTKNDDGPILRRYGLLVVAALFVIFGSLLGVVVAVCTRRYVEAG